jgi:DNA-binding XRE family transcriptional regulator
MEGISNEIKRKYQNNVLLMRLKAGFAKQKEFAKRTGICPSVICEIESGKRFLSSLYALRIAEVLECKLDDLFIPNNKRAGK